MPVCLFWYALFRVPLNVGLPALQEPPSVGLSVIGPSICWCLFGDLPSILSYSGTFKVLACPHPPGTLQITATIQVGPYPQMATLGLCHLLRCAFDAVFSSLLVPLGQVCYTHLFPVWKFPRGLSHPTFLSPVQCISHFVLVPQSIYALYLSTLLYPDIILLHGLFVMTCFL